MSKVLFLTMVVIILLGLIAVASGGMEALTVEASDIRTLSSSLGCKHWGNSGNNDVTSGLRHFFNSKSFGFYPAFSADFKTTVVQRTIPKRHWEEGGLYSRQDRAFIPSTTELGDFAHSNIFKIGSVYPFFLGASDADRIARLGKSNSRYRACSPDLTYLSLLCNGYTAGDINRGDTNNDSFGGSPALNLKSEIFVSGIKNADGTDGTNELFVSTPQTLVPTVTISTANVIGTEVATLNLTDTLGDYTPEGNFAYKEAGDLIWFESAWLTNPVSPYAMSIKGLNSYTTQEFKPQLKLNTTVLEGDILNFSTLSAPLPDEYSTIYWQNTQTGLRYLWFMDGLKVNKMGGIGTFGAGVWNIVGEGDLDGDGKPDIVWYNTETGLLYYWLMDGRSQLGAGGIGIVDNLDWRATAVGDMNGNGSPDIIWENTESGGRLVWFMDGVDIVDQKFLAEKPDPAWSIVVAADMNGNGQTDLILQNVVEGQRKVWLMNGLVIEQSMPFAPGLGSEWQIAAAGDLNRSGHNDIIWENHDNGLRYVWFMEGLENIGWGGLGTIPDLNWQIVGVSDLAMEKTAIDFYFPEEEQAFIVYLSTGERVNPGSRLTLRANVYWDEPVTAGGFVEFYMDGKLLDSVPFQAGAGFKPVRVFASTILCFESYGHLGKGEQAEAAFEARIVSDAQSYDTNGDNNSAFFNLQVEGIDREGSAVITKAGIASLKAISTLGDDIAVPGELLAIRAYCWGEGAPGSKSRLKLYINEELLYDKSFFLPSPGLEAIRTFTYPVPFNSGDTITIRAELESGHVLTLEIPVVSHDFELYDQGIYWELPAHTNAGNRVAIRCRIFSESGIPFGSISDQLRVLFIVNGEYSPLIRVTSNSAIAPHMGEAYYGFFIPEDCSWPLDVKVIIDPGNQFREKSESNNYAATKIPATSEGVPGPFLSISNDHLWTYPRIIIPGRAIQFFAALYNGSSTQAGFMQVKFFVDGEQINTGNDLYRDFIGGGQYHIFHTRWSPPDDLTHAPTVTVEVVPGSNQEGDDPGDNSASLELHLAEPDLVINEAHLYADYGNEFVSGRAANIHISASNSGLVSAPDVTIAAYLNGEEVGTKMLNLSARNTASFSIPITLPAVADLTPDVDDITSYTGWVEAEMGLGSAALTVVADPEDRIAESNKENNTFGPVNYDIITAPNRGAVYVSVRDPDGNNLSGAAVEISAGDLTASAVSDSEGKCSFHNVPFGPFELSVSLAGYNPVQSIDHYLSGGYLSAGACIILNDHSFIKGRVTDNDDNPLEGVLIRLTNPYAAVWTDSSGDYSIQVPAGTNLLKIRESGYARQDLEIDVDPGTTVTRNIILEATDLAYLYGWVLDSVGEPLAGMTVSVLNAENTVVGLPSTPTDSEGYFELEVSIPEPAVYDYKAQAVGHGLNKVVDLHLYRGQESSCLISFQPYRPPGEVTSGEVMSSYSAAVAPWMITKYAPVGTDKIEVETVYGSFEFNTSLFATNEVITDLHVSIVPDSWLYSGVSTVLYDFFASDPFNLAPNAASAIIDGKVTWSFSLRSVAQTDVRIMRIAIISGGVEAGTPVFPNLLNKYSYKPNTAVDWHNCRIKFYLKVFPDRKVSNPLAGNGCDYVLIEWDPAGNRITRFGHFIYKSPGSGYGQEFYFD